MCRADKNLDIHVGRYSGAGCRTCVQSLCALRHHELLLVGAFPAICVRVVAPNDGTIFQKTYKCAQTFRPWFYPAGSKHVQRQKSGPKGRKGPTPVPGSTTPRRRAPFVPARESRLLGSGEDTASPPRKRTRPATAAHPLGVDGEIGSESYEEEETEHDHDLSGSWRGPGPPRGGVSGNGARGMRCKGTGSWGFVGRSMVCQSRR